MDKVYLTHADVENLVVQMRDRIFNHFGDPRKIKIYGVPRGGIPVAYLLRSNLRIELVEEIDEADCIVDDLIDSGATMNRLQLQTNGKPFFALINKKIFNHGWVVFPWENGESDESATDIPTRMLQYIGEDINREGLIDTPKRVVKAWDSIFSGYKQDPKEILKTRFSEEYNEMVVLRDIEFYSMCEHHILPFFGKVHIAYVPGGKVVGISKLARLVDCFAKRAQIQERLTQQIADTIEQELDAQGVAVFVEAQHLCMLMRGVQKQNSVMVTSALRGAMMEKESARIESLLLKQ